MRFITMGSEKHPTILFIHGLSATAESCYGEVARLLQGKWHIVLCELDGHYPGSPEFENLHKACEEIEAYPFTNTNPCVIIPWPNRYVKL